MTTMIRDLAGFRQPGGAAPLVERLREAWAAWRLYSRTLAELEALSDRDLADLGISRHDVPRIAREAVYGE